MDSCTTFTSRSLIEYEAALARLVLATVFESTPHLGRPPTANFVVAVLTGSIRSDLVRVDAHRLSTFGVFAAHRRSVVEDLVATLAAKGFLERVHGRSGLVVTGKGRSLLETAGSRESEAFGIVTGAVPVEEIDRAIRAGLVDALRRFRSEVAHTEGVPEYNVFSEATLRAIATRLPRSGTELADVPGLGEKRRAACGFKILEIVSQHVPIIERLARGAAAPGDEVDQVDLAPRRLETAVGET